MGIARRALARKARCGLAAPQRRTCAAWRARMTRARVALAAPWKRERTVRQTPRARVWPLATPRRRMHLVRQTPAMRARCARAPSWRRLAALLARARPELGLANEGDDAGNRAAGKDTMCPA
eukprot:10640880-Alexandrium_andersonii.AAC.1